MAKIRYYLACRGNYRAYEIYAQEGAAFHEYDDDGKTQDYLSGSNTNTPIETMVFKMESSTLKLKRKRNSKICR